MQAIKRRVSWTLLALIPLVCALAVGWRGYTDSLRQQQNHALIEAVKRDDVPGVGYALTHGADANARDIPQDNRSMWRRLLDALRGLHPDYPMSPSALTLAVQHDVADDRPTPPEKSFVIIKALHDAGASAGGDTPPDQKDLNEDWQRLRYGMDAPTLPDCQIASEPCQDSGGTSADDAERAFAKYLMERGMSAQAYRGLVRSRFRRGDYDGAVHACAIAQLWLPHDKELAAQRAQVEEAQRISAAVYADQQGAFKTLAVQPFAGKPGYRLWAALCGRKGEFGVHAIHAALYRQTDTGLHRLCLSELLPDPRYGDEPADEHDFFDVEMYVLPLTRRRLPEIMVVEATGAGAYEPTQLHVLEWRGSRFKSLLSLHSNWPVWIENRRHDGRWLIRNDYETGARLHHNQMPHRRDFYAFNGDRYVLADRDYPGDFKAYISEAESLLVENPDDYDLLYNLYYLYRINGKRPQSERCYQKALRLFRENRAYDTDTKERSRNAVQLKRMLAREPLRYN